MKLTIRTLILGATVAGLALSATPSLAQGRDGRGGGQRPAPPSAEERAKARTEMLDALDLDTTQRAQVESVLTKLDAARQEIFDAARQNSGERGGDREARKEMRDQIKALNDTADTQLKSILSEEQYAKLVELRASHRGGRADRPARGGGRGR